MLATFGMTQKVVARILASLGVEFETCISVLQEVNCIIAADVAAICRWTNREPT